MYVQLYFHVYALSVGKPNDSMARCFVFNKQNTSFSLGRLYRCIYPCQMEHHILHIFNDSILCVMLYKYLHKLNYFIGVTQINAHV